MKKNVWFTIILLLLVGLLTVACGGSTPEPAAQPTEAPAEEAPAEEAPAEEAPAEEEPAEEEPAAEEEAAEEEPAAEEAADYPERPVEFVVPWPPGDLEDVLTRLIAEEMQEQTGVPAAVVNKPGGGGVVGAIDVFQAEADGHTIGSFVIGIPTVHVQSGNAPYARDDFEPVGIFVTYPFVIATAQDAPYSDMAELAEYSQDNDLSLGHFGFGLVPTRATLLSMEDIGGEFASEAAFDVLDCATIASGDADVINTTIQLLLPCLDEVKILASISPERLSVTPDTPTLIEQGGIDINLWNGLFVKKGTPQAVKDKIAEVAQVALNSDAAKDIAETTGASIYWLGEEDSQALIDSDWDTIADMIARMEDGAGAGEAASEEPAESAASGPSVEEALAAAEAIGYPERPVEFVVPWPPGDLEDVLTRLIAEEMQNQTGVPAAVVNKPGGGGVVGAIDVFQADPDGHTVGSFVIGIPTVHVQSGNAPYARDDFEPVGIFVTYPFVIAAAGDAPYSDMAELAAYSQENEVSLGHFGFGLVPTRATLLSMEDIGGEFASEAAFDVLDCATIASGDADVINTTIQLLLPCLDEVKILASISPERLSVTPDTPTLIEQGGIDINLWNGLFVKKGTPQEVKDLLAAVSQEVLNGDQAQEIAETTGASIYWLAEEESQALVDSDWDTIADMIARMEEGAEAGGDDEAPAEEAEEGASEELNAEEVLAAAQAIGYPERPIEFVVPWPPGDVEDVLTRLMAEEMQEQTGVPAAVVNKPGGGGVVGAIDVFQAEADGHTVGSFVIGIPTVHIQSGNAPYERDDFEPVGVFLTYPFVIAAAADAPYSDMTELAAYSQENEVSLGHFGFGLVPTRASLLSMEDLGGEFASEAAFDVLDCSTLASGDADVINTTIQLLLPCLDEVKILASISPERLSVAPDTATLAEQGGIDISLWNGLFVKKGTPQEVKDLLALVAQETLNSDAAKEIAETTGASIYWLNEEESQALIDADWDTIADMVERMGQ